MTEQDFQIPQPGQGFSDPTFGGGVLLVPAVQSPNYVHNVSGWAIFQNGVVEFNSGTFRGTITAGEFDGTDFVINANGIFYYSGPPANGNLILSVTRVAGTDGFGNPDVKGFGTYNNITNIIGQLADGILSLGGKTDTTLGTITANAGRMTLTSGNKDITDEPVQILITSKDATGGTGTPNAVISTGNFDMQVGINGGFSSNSPLEVQGIAGITDPIIQAIARAANDNAYGTRLFSDGFNRWHADNNGKQSWGDGAHAADAVAYRAAAGQLAADDILANVGGSAEVWNSLGNLGIGPAVNKARYRMMPTGNVRFEVDVTFGSSTAAPVTFTNTLPASYRVPGAVDARFPMAQTNATGGIARLFVGSASGGSPGSVQIAASANLLGTYSCYEEYSQL